MLDQPVPNPVAKNPNIYTHKVFAAVALILIGTIVAVAGIWWYVDNQSKENEPEDNSVKVSTTSAKPATSSATKDETADWKSYSSSAMGLTIKYPTDWLIESSEINKLCTVDQVFIAKTKELLGICASGFGGMISISKSPSGATASSYIPKPGDPSYSVLKTESVTLDGKTATKVTGTLNINNEVDDDRGTKVVSYVVDLGDRALVLSYKQKTTWPDYSKEFEQMVSTFKFL